MKLRILVASGALFAGVLSAVAADDTAAQPAATPQASGTALDNQLKELVGRIRAKLSSGARSEDALQDELKAFDALIAAQKGSTADDVARAELMRAMLYVDVFQDFEKGGQLLEQMQKDFAGKDAATAATRILAEINKQKASSRLQASLMPGTTFPDFDEKDLAGQPLSLGKYKGKVVLVDFWATWCGPCVAELPNVQAAYAKYHGKGFEIVGISLDQDEGKLKGFLAAKSMTWQQYFDGKGWESKLGTKYGVNSIPATYLLDGEGKIIAKDLRGEALGAKLEELLGKK